MYHVSNLAEVVKIYTETLTSQQQSQLESCLIKYCLPTFGFKSPEGKRTKRTTATAFEFLSNMSVASLKTLEKSLEWGFGANTNITSDVRRHNRHVLKVFLEWCTEEGYLIAVRDPAAKRMPKSAKRHGVITPIKVTNRSKSPSLSFVPQKASELLSKELEDLHNFYLDEFRPDRHESKHSPHAIKITDTSIATYFSWLIDEKGRTIESLTLSDIFPVKNEWTLKDVNDSKVVKELETSFAQYFNWERNVRHHIDSTMYRYLSGLLKVARYQYKELTDAEKFKYCSDVQICNTLRRYALQLCEGKKQVGNRRKDDIIEPEYEDLLEIARRLKKNSAPYTNNRTRRKASAVACSFQKYLWLALLIFIPPRRARVIRELEIGETFRKIDGIWTMTLWKRGSYKTYDTYGDITIPLPNFLSLEFDLWFNVHRPVFNPSNNFVFINIKGQPIKCVHFSSKFARAIRSGSDNKFYCSPHDIRAIVVSYLRDKGATDVEMESLALSMGHSRETQKKVYDRRNLLQKSLPAQELIKKLSGAD